MPATVVTTDVPSVLNVLPLLMINVPLTSAVALEASVALKLVSTVRLDPFAIVRSVPEPLPIVSVAPEAAVSVIVELELTVSLPTVCVGTFVIVCEVPELMTRTSLLAGVEREGVQLVEVAQLPPVVLFQVYVVCASDC